MENLTIKIEQNENETETRDAVYTSDNEPGFAEDMSNNKIPASVLRAFGAIIILIASAVYMFQGASSLDVYSRHFIFLGITALFGGLTWFLGAVIKENKGARTFTALAITTVPVLFTQLSSMIYTMLNKPDEGLGNYIVANSGIDFPPLEPLHFGLVVAATLIITLPTMLIGNRILARKQMLPLTGLLTVGNVLMLLPLRSSVLPLGIILAIYTGVALFYTLKAYKSDLTMRTKEGFIALANIFIPIVIMSARTVTLYQDGSHPGFIGLLFGLAGAIMVVLPMRKKESNTATFFQALGAFSVTAGWAIAAGTFNVNAEILNFYVTAIPFTAIIGGISYAMKEKDGLAFRRLPAVIFAGTLMAGQVLFNAEFALLTAVLSLVGGALLITFASKNQEKTPFILGGFTIFSGVAGLGIQIISSLNHMNWILMLGAGVVIIICASLSEVFNKKWKRQLNTFKDELTAWN